MTQQLYPPLILLATRRVTSKTPTIFRLQMAEAKRAAKRFAPLDPRIGNSAGAPSLKGIVFDVDGTLWCVAECSSSETY